MPESSIIHPRAVVAGGARLAGGVEVGPCAVIEEGVELAEGVRVGPHAVLRAGTLLGRGVSVDAHAVIGGLPQDVNFDPAASSGVRVGAGTVIREHVTINRSTRPGGLTEVGEGCYLMAACHLPHDARVGARTIIANAALFGGHVEVGADCFIGGSAVFHQNIRIGEGVMVSGNASFTRDIAPFLLAAGRDGIHGLNLVGLRRRGHPREEIAELKRLFREVLVSPGKPVDNAAKASAVTAAGQRFLAFFSGSRRGYARPALPHEVPKPADREPPRP